MKSKPDFLWVLVLILGLGIALSSYASSHREGLNAIARVAIDANYNE